MYFALAVKYTLDMLGASLVALRKNPRRNRLLFYCWDTTLLEKGTFMAGYSGTPLWKKLGYKAGMTVYVEAAPAPYRAWLGLPEEVTVEWLDSPADKMQIAHLFVTEATVLKARLKAWRRQIASGGMIWVSWPKKSSGRVTDITENLIREVALPTGLVDIKVCAVDEVWSGLKLVIRKELR